MHCTHHAALTPDEFEHLLHILDELDLHSRLDLDLVTTLFNAKFGFAKRSMGDIVCAMRAWLKERKETNEESLRASEAGEQEGPNDG